jgi:very-short-patch-repair endonuclease
MYNKVEDELARYTFANNGTFQRSTAIAYGFTDRQIASRVCSGIWVPVLPGVFRAASTPVTVELLRRAALLFGGDDAVLSHQSAGVLWQLDGIVEAKPEIIVRAGRNPRGAPVNVHHAVLDRDEVTEVDGFRCTSIARTISDLAHPLDEADLEAAIEKARRRHGTSLRGLTAHLERRSGPGYYGAAKLRRVLTSFDPGAPCESVLEVNVARLLRAANLPTPVRQFWIQVGGRRYRVDFAWPEWRVALECDGRAFHDFQRDRTRWRALGASGWRVLPITWLDATNRWDAVLADLGTALAA